MIQLLSNLLRNCRDYSLCCNRKEEGRNIVFSVNLTEIQYLKYRVNVQGLFLVGAYFRWIKFSRIKGKSAKFSKIRSHKNFMPDRSVWSRELR